MTEDKSLSIFRSFRRLNAKNLLYLQAEIVIKEKELDEIIQKDNASNQFPKDKFTCSVEMLKGEGSEQWTKFVELRQLLEKYSK